MIVQDGKMEEIATGLYILYFTFAGITTIVLILIVLCKYTLILQNMYSMNDNVVKVKT